MREINGPVRCGACGALLLEYVKGQEIKGYCDKCHVEQTLKVRQPVIIPPIDSKTQPCYK